MISLQYGASGILSGALPAALAPFAEYDPIRQIERASIRQFLERHRAHLKGRVLDFGAGKQPYKDLVEGEYVPVEQGEPLPGGYFDAVLCTQVIQYLDAPGPWLRWGVRAMLKTGGVLVMTYPTNWDEVEEIDYWRYTKVGMERLVNEFGLAVLVHERRAEVALGNFKFPLGYGLIARK